MESANDRWTSLSPQTQVEVPNHMFEEAGAPVTEIPMNVSVRRLEKSPHIHKYHLEAAVKVPGNSRLKLQISAPGQMRICLELRRGALIHQPQLSKDEQRGSFWQERQGAANTTRVKQTGISLLPEDTCSIKTVKK